MSTVSADVLGVRAAAIESSGWGRRFHFVQPRNACFWVYLVLVITGFQVMLQFATPGLQAYQASFTLSAVVFAVAGLPLLLILRHIDRYDSVPGGLALAAFVWGGFAGTGALALNANNALFSYYAKVFGHEFVFDWGPGVIAPFDEEFAKGIGILLLISLAPRLIRSAFDGLIVGGFIGLGFQVVENVTYGFDAGKGAFGADQISATMSTLFVRVAAGISSHWMYSAIFCAGLVWLIGRPDDPPRRLRGVVLMVIAMLCHGVWDASAGLTTLSPFGLFVSYLLVPIVLISTFVWAYKRSVVVERGWMRGILAPEVDAGLLSAEELDAVVGTRKARKHFKRSFKGHRAHVRAKHVLEAASDLGAELARSGGEYTGEVQRARRDIVELRG